MLHAVPVIVRRRHRCWQSLVGSTLLVFHHFDLMATECTSARIKFGQTQGFACMQTMIAANFTLGNESLPMLAML
jgi:hypothetical protein